MLAGQTESAPVRMMAEQSSAMVTFSAPAPVSWRDVGRALQLWWLKATALGLQVQPLGQIALVAAQEKAHTTAAMGEASANEIHDLAGSVAKAAGIDNAEQLAFIVRLFDAAPPSARALRKSVDDASSSSPGAAWPTSASNPLMLETTGDVKRHHDETGTPTRRTGGARRRTRRRRDRTQALPVS